MKLLLRTLAVGSLLAIANCYLSTAHAQGTAFTYQGMLNNAGAPAAGGLYDFRFKLYFDSLGNNQAGSTVLDDAVPATNGLFLTTVDFGPGIFVGSNYWLEVDVRSNNTGSYAELSPLQAVTPAPYAMFANTASNLSGTLSTAQFSGTYGNAVTLNNVGNNFSGTFVGNGVNVSNVNATALNGLNATNFWQLGGNIVSAGQVLGSINNQAVQMVLAGQPALQLIPDPTGSGAPDMIAGSPVNFINPGGKSGAPRGSVIVGGGATNDSYYGGALTNSIFASYSTIAGGANNTVSLGNGSGKDAEPDFSFIGGGYGNNANDASVIGGGWGNTAGGFPGYSAVVGGYGNSASGNGSFVGGGGQDLNVNIGAFWTPGNSANGAASAVVGGLDNAANGVGSFVGGGGDDENNYQGNIAGGTVSVIAGGYGNLASGAGSFVGGGGDDEIFTERGNVASGGASVVVGGIANSAIADYSTIPGGSQNVASGEYSFAAGQRALAEHQGAFVWADSQNASFVSTTNDSFNVRVQGGAYFVTAGGSLRLVPTASVPDFINGFSGNAANDGAQGVTIGGGGAASFANVVSSTLGTIAGGSGNIIGTNANDTTIGGGRQNIIDSNSWGGVISGGHGNWIQVSFNGGSFLGNSSYSTISGGYDNTVGTNALVGTIGGGAQNKIGTNAQFATVSGGENNTNNGNFSMIPGGFQNFVTGTNSLAAGSFAQATNSGAFVWGDNSGTITKSFTNNQFMARASGGVVLLSSTAASPTSYATGSAGVALAPNATSWSTVSDRNAKKNFQSVNTETVLEKLAAIPIQQWNYKWESDSDTPNIGPMAQDFKEAFYPGRDDKSISTLEFDGVELAAIQGLNQKLNEKDAEIQDLKKSVAELKQLVQTLAEKK